MMAAVQDALHAHTLLHRDIDYVVHDGQVLSVDEFKGRIVRDRRWPGGLQTALEWKEGVAPQGPGPRARLDHGGESRRALSHRLRHERHGRHAGPRLPRDVRSRRRGDPDPSSDDPRRSSGCGLRDESREGSGGHRRDSCRARERTTGAGRHVQRAGVGIAQPAAPRHCPRGAERAERGGGGRDRRARGRARRRHHFDQHGRARRRHPARPRRRRARRPSRRRHEPIREPAHRSPAARTRRPPGRSRQLAVLRVERGPADGQVRRRVRLARPGAANRRRAEPRHPAAVAQVRNHRRSAAATGRREAAAGADRREVPSSSES